MTSIAGVPCSSATYYNQRILIIANIVHEYLYISGSIKASVFVVKQRYSCIMPRTPILEGMLLFIGGYNQRMRSRAEVMGVYLRMRGSLRAYIFIVKQGCPFGKVL